MNALSSRERLLRTFRREPVDRMPVRIWGIDPIARSAKESWQPLYDLTEEYELDLIRQWRPVPKQGSQPPAEDSAKRRQSDDADMWERTTVTQTPDGPLSQINYIQKDGRPGYIKKHFVETVEDAKKWLSIPVGKAQAEVESYFELKRKTGDRAMLMVSLGEAMYAVNHLMGSEIFGYWLIDERELLREMIDRAFERIEDAAKYYLSHDLGDCYGWVGPELCIPPLASPKEFHEFCFEYDKRIIDMVHDAGKLVWVHCHGDMGPVLEAFADMGVDCLNPIEPPPCGSLTLAEAKQRIGDRMSLDGGVQDGDFDRLTPEQMTRAVEETVAQGKPGGGYILCPTSGPSTRAELTDRHIENYRAFAETGTRLAAYE